jgi:acyl-CoA reductase-like NAD-dependent aldehyde dehydrogenase
VVFDDAFLTRSVEGVARAVFANSGQMCIHQERIYVQDGIYDEFVPMLVERVRRMKLGASYDFLPEIGSLTGQAQLQKVKSHVEDAVEKGADLLCGGRERPDIGPWFYEPTLLADVTEEMSVCCEETFGPIASVFRFKTVEEVVERVNDSDYGLNGSVWTRDTSKGRSFAGWMQLGSVGVNDPYIATWGSVDSPMGGVKQSGYGRRHGDEGLLKYTTSQTVAVQRLHPVFPPKGMSAALFARILGGALKIIRRIPGVR